MKIVEQTTYLINRPFDAVQAMLDPGKIKHGAVAAALGIDKAAFSRRFTNPDSPVFRTLKDIESIMTETHRFQLLMYWADKYGFELTPKRASQDEITQYRQKKENGELPKP